MWAKIKKLAKLEEKKRSVHSYREIKNIWIIGLVLFIFYPGSKLKFWHPKQKFNFLITCRSANDFFIESILITLLIYNNFGVYVKYLSSSNQLETKTSTKIYKKMHIQANKN